MTKRLRAGAHCLAALTGLGRGRPRHRGVLPPFLLPCEHPAVLVADANVAIKFGARQSDALLSICHI
jgi:hypothetical protein